MNIACVITAIRLRFNNEHLPECGVRALASRPRGQQAGTTEDTFLCLRPRQLNRDFSSFIPEDYQSQVCTTRRVVRSTTTGCLLTIV